MNNQLPLLIKNKNNCKIGMNQRLKQRRKGKMTNISNKVIVISHELDEYCSVECFQLFNDCDSSTKNRNIHICA